VEILGFVCEGHVLREQRHKTAEIGGKVTKKYGIVTENLEKVTFMMKKTRILMLFYIEIQLLIRIFGQMKSNNFQRRN